MVANQNHHSDILPLTWFTWCRRAYRLKEAVEEAVFYFRRKAQKERITLRGVVRDWVNSEGGAFWTIILFLGLFLVGAGYAFFGKDFFSKEGPWRVFAMMLGVMWLLLIMSVEVSRVDKRINELNEQISEMNQRLSDMDTAIRQLNQESDSNGYGKGR